MRRADVFEYILGSHRVRILIVSADPYNPRRATYLLLLGPDSETPSRKAFVPTGTADAVQGTVDVTRLRPLVQENLGARLARLSPTTMRSVDAALAAYLGL